jgi:hypothetical protein
MTFTFTGTLFASDAAGGTVSYHWARSDGSVGAPQTATFSPGQTTTQSVSDSWTLPAAQGTGATYTDQIVVTAPNTWYSTQGAFGFTCQVHVASITATANPTALQCVQIGTVTFTATLALSPNGGGDVTYVWWRDGSPESGPQALHIAPGQTTATLTDLWSGNADSPLPTGTHQEQLVVSTPNQVSSNAPTFANGGC